jgi:hypothetical protein
MVFILNYDTANISQDFVVRTNLFGLYGIVCPYIASVQVSAGIVTLSGISQVSIVAASLS